MRGQYDYSSRKESFSVLLWILRGVALILTIVWAISLDYWAVPAKTFQSLGFWLYLTGVIFVGFLLFAGAEKLADESYLFTVVSGVILCLFLLLWLILSFSSWETFNAKSYASTIEIQTGGDAKKDLPRVQNAQDIPIVDMMAARQLGDRTMGTISKNQSQYEVDDEYNLISYRGKDYRISPLLYGDFWKYKNSKEDGIPGYVLVDVYTGSAELIELDEPIRYSPSAFREHNLKRHLRGIYPTYIFGKPQFEIDDEGTTYYIVPVEKVTGGLFGARIIQSAIIVNACTGEAVEYTIENIPSWVDHVFSVEYLMQRVDWYYGYMHGWRNAITSKKDMQKTSYNFDNSQYYFIHSSDGVCVYTGMSSEGKDESNFGFILANTRTGKVTYYLSPGAEESSAQASAEGIVQQTEYKAGPVMLVNIDDLDGEQDIETYFMTMKDKQGLVKMFALVNKQEYSKAVVKNTIEEAVNAYQAMFNEKNVALSEPAKTKNGKGSISELYTAVQDGNTNFYFKLQGGNTLYISSISNNAHQITMEIGDTVNIEFVAVNDDTALVQSIKIE